MEKQMDEQTVGRTDRWTNRLMKQQSGERGFQNMFLIWFIVGPHITSPMRGKSRGQLGRGRNTVQKYFTLT